MERSSSNVILPTCEKKRRKNAGYQNSFRFPTITSLQKDLSLIEKTSVISARITIAHEFLRYNNFPDQCSFLFINFLICCTFLLAKLSQIELLSNCVYYFDKFYNFYRLELMIIPDGKNLLFTSHLASNFIAISTFWCMHLRRSLGCSRWHHTHTATVESANLHWSAYQLEPLKFKKDHRPLTPSNFAWD